MERPDYKLIAEWLTNNCLSADKQTTEAMFHQAALLEAQDAAPPPAEAGAGDAPRLAGQDKAVFDKSCTIAELTTRARRAEVTLADAKAEGFRQGWHAGREDLERNQKHVISDRADPAPTHRRASEDKG